MAFFYDDGTVQIHHGDARELLAGLKADVIVTDPPYGLEFMGKEWDRFSGAVTDRNFKGFKLSSQRTRNVKCPDCNQWAYDHPGRRCECGGVRRSQLSVFQTWTEEWARAAWDALPPGGWLLAFGGTRTWHRLACGIEDAGFEIRDTLMWLYGSGFPKSLDVGKAIDKLNGKPLDRLREFGAYMRASREAAGLTQAEVNRTMDMPQGCGWWEGKGLGDKWDLHLPSRATWVRLKALYGLGNEWDWLIEWAEAERVVLGHGPNVARRPRPGAGATIHMPAGDPLTAPATPEAERWQGWGTALKPAWEPIIVARKPLAGSVAQNVLTYGTGALNIDATKVDGNRWPPNVALIHGKTCNGVCEPNCPVALFGEVSRYFYTAKAPRNERVTVDGEQHPTVKPLSLMRWLVRLVCPPGGVVLDPFCGSGSTLVAARMEGFRAIGVEADERWCRGSVQRLAEIPPTQGVLL